MRNRFMIAAIVCVSTLGSIGTTPAAVENSASHYGDLHWRLLGPFRGGRVLAVAGVLNQPQHFYFGAVNGGVWETLDAGRTWQPIFDSQPVGSIGAIAVADSDPKVIYVGSGEADMRSDIAQGDGMYRSSDGGKIWKKIGLEDSQQIGKILIDPADANTVFVAALGHPYGPNAQRGVFRSHDGGAHWQRVLGEGDAVGATDLAFEPGHPNVIYAAMWQARRTPWSFYPPASGPGSGLYKSIDGGSTWTQIKGNGFPDQGVGRIGIAVAPNEPSRVYAIVDGDDGGLYRSDDAGAHWRKTSGDIRIWQRGWYFGRITVDPVNADRVYAMNTIVLRSDDGGVHFIPLKGDPTGDDFHELWIDPANPQRQILGVDQGAIVTLNGGATWSSWHNQPTAQMYHVSTDNRFPYRVYGAQQDSGAVALPSAATGNALISMEQFKEVTAGGEAGMIAPDPNDPDIVYGGGVDRFDLRTEQTRSLDPTLAEPDELYRRTWTLPLVFNKVDSKVLYYANQKLFRTRDQGAHWDTISPDLTREKIEVPANLDAVTAANHGGNDRRGVIYAIAPSPLDAKLLWLGTDDGLIWRTRDEGAHWDNVTPSALTVWSKVGMIEASHFDAGTAYAAIDRHRLDDRRPYIYRTRDGGAHWESIVTGIRDGDFVNAVREDPKQRGLLYAATELGMYVSFDDGARWQPLQMNLPRTSVRDIDVHGDDLVIATHGRGFWILDDVASLRQFNTDCTPGATRLFAPSTAIRVRPAGFTGTPLPKDEPTAVNPAFGARLDYFLASTPKQPLQLSIRDSGGHLVRHYASTDKAPKLDLATIGAMPEWSPPPSTLATTLGLHRFLWPIRYPSLPALADGDAFADGVWAPPDRYTVELQVDGKTFRQPLTIAPDPRITLTTADYAQQFAFARKVEVARARVAAAQTQANTLHAAVTTVRIKAAPPLVTVLDEFDRKLKVVSGLVDTPNPNNASAMPATSTESLRFVREALDKLAGAADGADGAPTTDALAGYDKLMPLVEHALANWRGVTSTDLAAVNAQLKRAGQQPLEPEVNGVAPSH